MWVSLCELAAENAFGARRGGSVTRIAEPVALHVPQTWLAGKMKARYQAAHPTEGRHRDRF